MLTTGLSSAIIMREVTALPLRDTMSVAEFAETLPISPLRFPDA